MEAVRRTVELGRAARAQAKVKLRQPLRKAVVVASDAERAAIERLTDVVASELNVKELDFVTEEAELVCYRVQPNYRSLGPRFGKNMPQVAAAVEALDAGEVAERSSPAPTSASRSTARSTTSTADDINLVMEPLEGYQVEAEAGHAVALELDLDDELRREGLAREVVRAVQEARKEAGLEVSDRISLELGGDEELLDAAREHESYVAGETLATSVDYGADGAGEKATIEGRELRIAGWSGGHSVLVAARSSAATPTAGAGSPPGCSSSGHCCSGWSSTGRSRPAPRRRPIPTSTSPTARRGSIPSPACCWRPSSSSAAGARR